MATKINSINNKSVPLTIEPGSGADSILRYSINASDKFTSGAKNSDSSYRLSVGSALGTTDAQIFTSAGEQTLPGQTAFLVVLDTTVANVTGNNNDYIVVYDTEVYDINGNMTTTTFTAPVTGMYRLQFVGTYGNVTAAADNGLHKIITSNFSYQMQQNLKPDSNNNFSNGLSILADMDVGDTATSRLNARLNTPATTISAVGTGSSAPSTYFSGCLEM